MPAAYIDRRDTRITYSAGVMTINSADGRQQRLPLAQIDFLVLRSNISVDTSVLTHLAQQGTSVLLMDGRSGQRTAWISGYRHGRAARRIAQYQAHIDTQRRLAASRLIVALKLRSHWRHLRTALSYRPDQRLRILTALRHQRTAVHTLRDANDLAQLRGIEGAAAAAYFSGYAAMMPADAGFNGRNRRPPRDPANAALSLGYTLLHADACRVLLMTGLDPMLGLFHELAHGREALACDLSEPWRFAIDHLVWRLFAEQKLRAEHFETHNGACLMKKSARSVFYPAYEQWAYAHRPALLRMAQRFAAIIEQRDLQSIAREEASDLQADLPS